MKLAIMQPYFFPYLGYLSLIKCTDEFILFDTVQFIRHGWIERNRILKQDSTWQYISVPLQKHHLSTLIKDIKIDNTIAWKEKILAQLTHYKKRASFYYKTIDIVNKSCTNDTDSITKLNYNILKNVCEYLGINFNCKIFSEMNLEIEEVNAPDEWALNICKSLCNVDEYINPIGGLEFFDSEKYKKNNIKISFLKHNLPTYPQLKQDAKFEEGLSIIDVLMFNSPEKIREMLDDYELI